MAVCSGQWAVIVDWRGTFAGLASYQKQVQKFANAMRAYLANLTAKGWVLLALPILAIAYPVVTVVVPAVIRAVVPDVVRSVLTLI
ncbi:MAG: hypothetical protein WB562_19145 [Candidatus Sulfotelmatobacter sp.]